MDFFDTIKTRHSYRGAFLDQPVDRATLEKIVESGRAAPSACGKQSPRFIIIDDPVVKKEITAIVGHGQPSPMLDTAPAFIAVVMDPRPVYGTTNFGPEDCAAVTTLMLCTITALGLASVWLDGAIRGDEADALNQLLNVPAPFCVRILLPLGTPAKPGAQPARLPAAKRVAWNTFNPELN